MYELLLCVFFYSCPSWYLDSDPYEYLRGEIVMASYQQPWKPCFDFVTNGGDPTGKRDSTRAVQVTLATASSELVIDENCRTVYAPRGTFLVRTIIFPDGPGPVILTGSSFIGE